MHRCYLEEELSSSKLNKYIIRPISETGVAEASILLRSKESLSAYKPFINRFGKRKTAQLVLCFPVGPAAGCALCLSGLTVCTWILKWLVPQTCQFSS